MAVPTRPRMPSVPKAAWAPSKGAPIGEVIRSSSAAAGLVAEGVGRVAGDSAMGRRAAIGVQATCRDRRSAPAAGAPKPEQHLNEGPKPQPAHAPTRQPDHGRPGPEQQHQDRKNDRRQSPSTLACAGEVAQQGAQRRGQGGSLAEPIRQGRARQKGQAHRVGVGGIAQNAKRDALRP